MPLGLPDASPGASWPAANGALQREWARRQQEAQMNALLQQQGQQGQGQFPGHPANAASVSDDYLKSYDAQGYELDSLGNRAFGSWGDGGGGSGGAAGAGGVGGAGSPQQWGTATGTPTPWWLPGLSGSPGNPWGQIMQLMQSKTQGLPMNQGMEQYPVVNGGLPPGTDPRAVAADPAGFQRWLQEAMGLRTQPAQGNTNSGMPNMGEFNTTPYVPGQPDASGKVAYGAPQPFRPGVTPDAGTPQGQPGMPNWAQPTYNESPYQNLNPEQWQRNLEAAAGIYFPMMNYMQGADQFNQTLAEQKQGNRWSEGFQDRTWNSEFGEGNRRYNQDFSESARRYGQDFGESSRRFDTELKQRQQEAAWQRTADAFNVTGRAVMPRARYVSYR